MSSLVDSHCHLYYDPYINDIQATINECKKNNINKFLTISVNIKTSKINIELAEKYEEIYCTIGIHPNNAVNCYDEFKQTMSLFKKNKKIIGIGEAGLDFYRSRDNLLEQIKVFKLHIEFSIENNLPLIVHSRNAEKETIEILQQYKNYNLKFILHCFSGTKEFAKNCLDLNGFLAFGGILTFNNSNKLRELSSQIPLNRILLETDSPYLSPHPLRGKSNHPKNLIYIAKYLSEIKKLSLDNIASITTRNFNNLFNLKE